MGRGETDLDALLGVSVAEPSAQPARVVVKRPYLLRLRGSSVWHLIESEPKTYDETRTLCGVRMVVWPSSEIRSTGADSSTAQRLRVREVCEECVRGQR